MGRTIELLVYSHNTVLELKFKIYYKLDIPTHNQGLIYGNTLLVDDGSRTLNDYGIKCDSTIYLVVRVPGGGFVDDLLSHCVGCPGEHCEVLRIGNWNNAFIKNASEDVYIALCDVFNISSEVKLVIEDNNAATSIRCLDVIHHLYHVDPSTFSWRNIKIKLKPKYPDISNQITPNTVNYN